MNKTNYISRLVVATAIAWNCGALAEVTSAQESAKVVVATKAATSSIPVYLEPYRSIEMSSVESGVIGEILVREGQVVQKGQELLKLDLAVLEAQLAVAIAQAEGKGRLMAAEADYELNSERLQKLEALRAAGRTNAAEIDRQVATTKSSQGMLLAAEEEMKIYQLSAARIRTEVERRILRSPIDGVVVEIVKDVAEPVSTLRSQSGEPDYLIRVVELDLLKTTAHLPYASARDLEVGDYLKVLVEGDQVVNGLIEYVSPIVKSSTGTVEVRLRIDNAERKLRGGTSARVVLGGGSQ